MKYPHKLDEYFSLELVLDHVSLLVDESEDI